MNLYLLLASLWVLLVEGSASRASPFNLTRLEHYFATFTDKMRLEARELTREMFYFGYESYMAHAWPEDELDPIHCTGRGPDREDPSNININDVLGDFQLTLIDTLDSLAVFGDEDEFKRAVSRVMHTVSFEKDSTVQVFETTIRVIGGLLSAHLIATDESGVFGSKYRPSDYDDELLSLAHEMAVRLMPAFDGTETGLPYPRVNLMRGVVPGTINETCVSGAGTLLLEMGVLSRLTGDQTFELAARRINDKLFSLRNYMTGLFGNVVDIMTGEWRGYLSGVGAGLDSFYEYLLKAYILFGERRDLEMFNETYEKHLNHARRGRTRCVGARGEHPLFVNVDARDGSTANTWIDALQAAWPGVQLLAGDVDEAVCQHAVYYAVWSRFGALPERYNWMTRDADVSFYPLRPELAESTYLLYRATRNPFYLHVGRDILHSLNNKTRVECGFATIHDVNDGSLEDRMESFFLSETLKYLYLLFDESNAVNVHEERLLFTTEGHIFPIDERWRRRRRGERVKRERHGSTWNMGGGGEDQFGGSDSLTLSSAYRRASNVSCERPPARQRPPLDEHQLVHLFKTVGIDLTAS